MTEKTLSLKELLTLANKGDSDAQYDLGWMYESGEGVKKDLKEAFKWFSLAAKQGDAGAQFNLGWMYESGEGATKNPKEALKYYELAANQGDPDAQYSLGLMLANGEGCPQDLVGAYMWFTLADIAEVDEAIDVRDEIEEEMSDAQIVKAEMMTKEWIMKNGTDEEGIE